MRALIDALESVEPEKYECMTYEEFTNFLPKGCHHLSFEQLVVNGRSRIDVLFDIDNHICSCHPEFAPKSCVLTNIVKPSVFSPPQIKHKIIRKRPNTRATGLGQPLVGKKIAV
jgi:hypothetical protein